MKGGQDGINGTSHNISQVGKAGLAKAHLQAFRDLCRSDLIRGSKVYWTLSSKLTCGYK